jgi:hypothetical protein
LAAPPAAEPLEVATPNGDSFSLDLPEGRYRAVWDLALGPHTPHRPPKLRGEFESDARPPQYFSLYLGDELHLSIKRSDAAGGTAIEPWRFVLRPQLLKVDWVYPNEEAWIVGTTARDIAEMMVYAANRSLPAEKDLAFSAKAAPAGDPGVPRYSVSLSPRPGVPVSVTLTFSDHIWSPERQEPLATEMLKVLGLAATGTSGESRVLEALADPRSGNLERESQRVSRRLAEAMLDPAAHEEAAVILGALALREGAARFSDPRQTLCRMAAHLAVARALRREAPSLLGRHAEAVLVTLVNRQREALERITSLERGGPLPGAGAWLRALRIRNTRDWRILKRPAAASLLERLEHYRALQRTVGASMAMDFFQSFKPEPISDWGRIVLGHANVEEGNVFGTVVLKQEMDDAVETWEAYHGTAWPADAAEALNARPERLLLVDAAGKATPRVIGWGVWARFFHRNFRFEADARATFMAQSLGSEDAAREFRKAVIEPYSRLDLFPLQMAEWATSTERGHSILEGGDAELGKIRHESCVSAVALMRRIPELLTAEVWARAEGACTQESDRQALTPRWFSPAVPAGTALFDQGRQMLIGRARVDLPETVAALHALAPFDPYILRTMNRGQSFPELAGLYGPLAEYDIGSMLNLARSGATDPTKAIPLYSRLSAINPDYYFALADYLFTLDREEEGVAACEKGVKQARDRVAMSHHAFTLVRYYCDHGRVQRAGEVAKMAADVYSAPGLEAMAYFMERTVNYSEAEGWYKKVAERYHQRDMLDIFYIRYQHRVGGNRFRAEADAALKQVFPGGFERVSLAGLKAPPPRSATEVRISGKSLRRDRLGLLEGDLVIALDGVRVRTSQQYECLWTLADNPEATVIVWRQNQFLEVKGPLRRARYDPVKAGPGQKDIRAFLDSP